MDALMKDLDRDATVSLTEEDRALVATIGQAIASIKRGHGRAWEDVVRDLEKTGWEVGWHLAWVADAKRPGAHEQAVGKTLDDAFAQLSDLTLLDTVEGCP